MTMKYAHIGIADQARALASLHDPQAENGDGALQMRCNFRYGECHEG